MQIHTVGEALCQWLAIHSVGRKPRSQEFNREIHGVVIEQWPGPLNASPASVTPQLVTTFAARVQRYCPSRWNAMVSAVRFLTPVGKVLKFRPLKSKERPLYTQEQFTKLLAEVDTRPRSHAGLVVRFLSRTGLRINEARQLLLSDVLTDRFLLRGSTTKNGKPRVVPFIDDVALIVERLKAIGDGERVLPQASCKRALATACERAGLPRLTHHDIRHLFTTRCIECGVDLPTIARWLGWADDGVELFRRYFHLLDEHSRRMAARVRI